MEAKDTVMETWMPDHKQIAEAQAERISPVTYCATCGQNKNWGDNSELIGSDGKPIVQWLIIGACTGTREEMTNLARNNKPFLTEMPWGTKWTAQPNPEWVREIVEAADKAGIKVFLKDNLKPLVGHACTIDDKWVWAKDLGYGGLLRQEMPK